MDIVLAKTSGFCFGVKRALEIVNQAILDGKEPLYTLGPLVHNRHVVDGLSEAGVHVIKDFSSIEEGYVVIRAHGVPPKILQEARSKEIFIIDATCPFVKKAQDLAAKLLAEGYAVVIIGEREHAEVLALQGWAGGDAFVVESEEEAKALPFIDQIGVVVQTTQIAANVDRIIPIIRSKCRDFKFHNTICSATDERQCEACTLAKKVDLMVVVGGRHSANTNRLLDVCKQHAPNAVLVESNHEIKLAWLQGVTNIGVTAGASTPDWLIKGVIERMTDEIRKEEEVSEQQMGEQVTSTEEVVADSEEVKETAPVEEKETEEAVVAEVEEAIAEEEVEAVEEPQEETTPEPEVESSEEEEEVQGTIADYEETLRALSPGQIVTGVVMEITDKEVLVDVGYKSEGSLPIPELSRQWVSNPEDVVKVGEEIEVYIDKIDKEGQPILSKRRADEQRTWDNLQGVLQEGNILNGTVKEAVKGGLLVDVGVIGFVPASHVDVRYVQDLTEYVGKEMDMKVLELDNSKKRVVLSRRKYLEEEYSRKRDDTLAELAEGQVKDGTVKSITDFGVFIDLGGIDGLLHVSEMSWGRVKHPSDILEVGESLKVKILGVDKEKGRISLGLKQILADPWDTVTEKYPEGSVVTGKVVRLVAFGAFVELEPGVDGLIHISQMAHERVEKPEDVVTIGDEIETKVISVRPDEHRIGLSVSQLTEAPKKPQKERPARPARKPVQKKQEFSEYMDNGKEGMGITIGDLLGKLTLDAKDAPEEKPEKTEEPAPEAEEAPVEKE